MPEPLGRVAVFWHYDNLPPPGIGGSPREISHSTHNAIVNIRQALFKFGIITCFKAYVGSMPLQAKWELQSHGVTVIECIWNASETMITADMFRFAMDNPSQESTIVLISSSFTLAYTVSVLGIRRYRVVLISIPDPHNSVLVAQASEVIDWRFLISPGISSNPQPPNSPPAMQNSSGTQSPEHIEYPHINSGTFRQNMAETLEHSFTISDLNLTGSSGERSASPSIHPNAPQLEFQQPPPIDGRPPSRQIEEAIMNYLVEDTEDKPGPRSFDSSGQRIDLLTRPFNRSVSELALGGNTNVMRPRSNSLQDDRRIKSPSGLMTLGDHILVRSLPLPTTTPLSWSLSPRRPLNVEAPPFIPSPGSNTPPSKPSEDSATTLSPAPDPSPIEESVEETRSPSLRSDRSGSTSSTCSVSSTSSTVKPVVSPVPTAAKPAPPTKQRYTKSERRAVETMINVLLGLKSKGQARVSPRNLAPLLLAKDRTVYRGVGGRGNRFWKLVDLGIQMGWLEAGPGKAWIDIGKGWAEETNS